MAWLAVAAMWLLVAAPTVSRVLPALVSTDMAAHAGMDHASMPGMDDMPGMVHLPGMPGMPDMPGDPAQHLDHCGYCTMLAHTPLLSGAVVALLLAAPLPAVAPVARSSITWHAQPVLSAHPRGPPSIQLG
ncbi:DUF2946 domain-containing protein [Dyella sp. 2RAF44]